MNARAFAAPRWLRSAHLQTSWAPLLRRPPSLARPRENFRLPDDDSVLLDWFDADHAQPLVLVLHGLAGSTDSIYVLGIQHALQAAGISSVAMNFRGAAGIPNRRARTYHAGDTGDLDAVMRALAARFPGRLLGVTGYSLGGNVVLKWLGEGNDARPVQAACAVSVPFDLGACAARLDQGLSRLYRDRLMRELLTNLATKQAALRNTGQQREAAQLAALGSLQGIRSFRDYDQRVIAPLHGFRDADDYYRQSSARAFVGNVRQPTLLVHALDDPFMTPAVVPPATALGSGIEPAISTHGGHVGFVQGTPAEPRYWLEERIPEFFRAQFART